MPSTLKRPSLARLLASLRPSRGGTLPVWTGFLTSLADLVVQNHGRLRKPRKPRRPAAVPAPPPSTAPAEVADELTPPSSPEVRRQDSPRPQKGGACFRLCPGLLAQGGAVALAVLEVWSEGTVGAFTVAALSLLCIESATRRRRHRRRHPTDINQTMALLDSCGPVSPIREVDDEAPPSSCSDSDRGSEGPSPRTAETGEFTAGGGDPTTPKQKAKRSLKKLISKKLQKKPKPKDSACGEAEQPDAGGCEPDPVLKTESSVTASESSTEWSSVSSSSSEPVVAAIDGRRPGVKLPLLALAPVIRRREAPGDGAGRAVHSVLQRRPATVAASDGRE